MKICPNCASLYGDDLLMCPKCNCELVRQGAVAEDAGDTAGRTANPSAKKPTNSRTSSNPGTTSATRNSGGRPTNQSGNQARRPVPAPAYRQHNDSDDTIYPRKRSFYERGWFIALSFICWWPIGIFLIILRIHRNNVYESNVRNRRSGGNSGNRTRTNPSSGNRANDASQNRPHTSASVNRVKEQGPINPATIPIRSQNDEIGAPLKMVGAMLLAIGIFILVLALILASGEERVLGMGAAAFALCLPGGILFYRGKKQHEDCEKFDGFIDKRGNTKIAFIASKVYMTQNEAKLRINELIEKGFLMEPANHIAAHIDWDYDLVVMTYQGEPIVPVEKTMKKEIEKKKAAEKEATRKAMKVEDRYHATMEEDVPMISDEEVVKTLQKIDRHIKTISSMTKNTSDADMTDSVSKNVQNMKKKYIPKTIELIERYVKPTTTPEMKEQIKEMFRILEEAFDNIREQIIAQDEIGADIEMEILKQTLASDGVLDSDFDLQQKGN